MTEKQIFFTIITKSYLPLLKVLAKSLAETQKSYKLFCFVFDSKIEKSKLDELEGIEILYPEDIDENFMKVNSHWIYKYSIIEACTAIKPKIFKFLFKINPKSIINYVDPDLFFINEISELNDLQNRNPGIYLTPHLLQKGMDIESIISNELSVLKHGVFNLGFISIANSNSSQEFLNWWEERLINFGEIDYGKGLFTDQKWIDLAPVIFENINVLRHPGYNVSTWNIRERENLLKSRNDFRFIHMSGYYSGAHFKVMSNIRLENNLFNKFLKDYYMNEQEVNHLRQGEENWQYDYNKYGEKITRLQRNAWKEIQELTFKKQINPYNFVQGNSWNYPKMNSHAKRVLVGENKNKFDPHSYYDEKIQFIMAEVKTKKVRIMHLWHGQGGGVEEAVRIISDVEKSEGMASMTLTNRNSNYILKYSGVEELEIEIPKNEKIIHYIFKKLNVNYLIFHSLEFNYEYEYFINMSNCMKYFFFHDFSFFSKNWNYMDIFKNKTLTSFEDIFIEYKEANQHIVDQRLEILSNAQKIIVASETAKKYCVAFGIREDIINLISFPEYGNIEKDNNTEKHDNDSGYIVVIANINEHKGIDILKELSNEIAKQKSKLKILIYGACDKEVFINYENIEIGGKVPRWRLKILLRQSMIKVIIFPFLAPETYSFALSDAISSGKPIVVPNSGVFYERTADLQNVEYVDIFSRRKGSDWLEVINKTLSNENNLREESHSIGSSPKSSKSLMKAQSYLTIFSERGASN